MLVSMCMRVSVCGVRMRVRVCELVHVHVRVRVRACLRVRLRASAFASVSYLSCVLLTNRYLNKSLLKRVKGVATFSIS